eukprot:11020178-Alexandrium_andersonii.AAC.1
MPLHLEHQTLAEDRDNDGTPTIMIVHMERAREHDMTTAMAPDGPWTQEPQAPTSMRREWLWAP